MRRGARSWMQGGSFSPLGRVAEYKEAFALFDKKGTGAVPREVLGDLLRALGQNPTQAEVAEIIASAPRDGACLACPFNLRRLTPRFVHDMLALLLTDLVV